VRADGTRRAPRARIDLMTTLPRLARLDDYFPSLCRMVAETSWLPHPDTVRAMGRAVFPTSRARKDHPRFEPILHDGRKIGMYDDNTTPTWALLWTHGIVGGSRTGWAFAHVWTASDDVNSYTHPANLAMVPECLASLTDKSGPLTAYLRWHAWTSYGWKPDHVAQPDMPTGFTDLEWRYFAKFDEPRSFIARRIAKLDNARIRFLRPIMQELGTL
jgi:hypothetical protein